MKPRLNRFNSSPSVKLAYGSVMNWIALLAISATSAFAQTGSTYSEWAQIWFPSGGPSAAPDADPDGDSIPNITEFAFGLTPDAANTAPLFNLSLQGASSERLGFQYYLRTSASNVLVIPQATENLVTGAWRADQFTISSYEYPYPSDITSVGAVDSPSGIPSKRFIRLLVAMDSDGDGISDDWEVAHGLLPFDESDKGADLDGDGDSSWLEFLQGTDPQDANSNSGQFRIPRAPRDVRIQGVSTLTVGWDDVSDNETGFRIYDAAGVLIGTVPADAREFELPATFVFGESVSVTAANAFGESGPTTSFTEPGGGSPRDPIDGGLEISDYDAYSRATAPKIDIKRTTAQTVVVDWRCASLSHLTNTGKKIRIMRQRQGDEWQNIFEAPFEGNETGHHDDNAPAGTTYKYSAMIVMNGPFGLQGSDAAYPAVDDYVESLYGMRMNRSYTASGEMTAPGNNMTAAEPKDRDWFYLKANRAGKGLPSFIPEGGPELENFTTDIDANRGWRYFEAGGVSDTVLAFKGFVVRGGHSRLVQKQP